MCAEGAHILIWFVEFPQLKRSARLLCIVNTHTHTVFTWYMSSSIRYTYNVCFLSSLSFGTGYLTTFVNLQNVHSCSKRKKENPNLYKLTPFANKYIQFWFHKSYYFMQSIITLEQFPTFLAMLFHLVFSLL